MFTIIQNFKIAAENLQAIDINVPKPLVTLQFQTADKKICRPVIPQIPYIYKSPQFPL
jgi:hypothetical protein